MANKNDAPGTWNDSRPYPGGQPYRGTGSGQGAAPSKEGAKVPERTPERPGNLSGGEQNNGATRG